MTDREFLIRRLKEKLERLFRDAQHLHLCSVADKILAARAELQKEARARMGVETEAREG